MASLSTIASTPESEVLNFKQKEGENLKDAWYRICNAQNRSTRKQSTTVLLRNFYVGVSPWNRYVLDTITGGNFLGSHTVDSYSAMINLVGSPPLVVNETVLTLEHVMQRLDVIENKVATVELIENLDKKIHNQITQYGSKVGMTLKNLREKEPIVNEKIDQDSTRIRKLEDIITNLGSAFASVQTTPNFPPTKTAKFIYVPKNKGESSSKENEDLKMISVHPNFINIIKEPIATSEFLDFLPRSMTIDKTKESPRVYKGAIEELHTKDDNT
jgi:hypothetical protein